MVVKRPACIWVKYKVAYKDRAAWKKKNPAIYKKWVADW